MLRLEDVHAHYGWLHALRGFSLNVEEGEIVAVVGPNGAGKTTMLKAIMGLIPATRGKILYRGEVISNLDTETIVRRGIGLVPEGKELFTNLSALDNLRLGSYSRGKSANKNEIQASLESVFSLFPRLKERARQIAGTLSGGEQQMLAIGRALMARPKLLLLDEPSIGLAPMVVAEIFEVIDSLRRQGTTVLVVEQNINVVLNVADRGYVIRQGGVVLTDKAAALLSNVQVGQLYLGR